MTYCLLLLATALTGDLTWQLSLLRPDDLGVVDRSIGVLFDAVCHVAHLDAMFSQQVKVQIGARIEVLLGDYEGRTNSSNYAPVCTYNCSPI